MRTIPTPGTYGRVCYDGMTANTACIVKLTGYEHTADELREAAHFFNQLAEIMGATPAITMKPMNHDKAISIAKRISAENADVLDKLTDDFDPIIRHQYRVSVWHSGEMHFYETFEYEDQARDHARRMIKAYAAVPGTIIKCRKIRLTPKPD